MTNNNIPMLHTKGEGINHNLMLNETVINGKYVWMVVSRLHAIGSDQQRELINLFPTKAEAKAFFDGKVAHLRKSFYRLPNAVFEEKETNLIVTKDNNLVAHITIIVVPAGNIQ